MTQRAMVRKRLSNGRVEITVKRESACSHNCADCAGCGSMIHAPEITAVALDELGARAGQRVLYLLPFVGLFAAAVGFQRFGEGVAAAGAVTAFVAVLAGVSLPLERYLRRHKAVTYRVVAVEE